MTESFQKAKNLLEQSKKILFTTHERTDGDDLGSVLALAIHLKSTGKSVTVCVTGGVPDRLSFLPMSDDVKENIEEANYDLLVISGCSNIERINNSKIQTLQIPTINFDHHPDNQNFATVNVVQSNKSSVAELVYDFFKFNDWQLSPEVSTCLLTGIITDTGLFMHSNTQAETYDAASDLVKNGGSISNVAKNTITSPDLLHLIAWGKGLENSYFDPEKKIIYSILTQDLLSEMGNPDLNNFEGFVETLNKVPEAKYAMLIKEEDGRVKGSLRSDPFKGTDVQKIAKEFGGGGHKWAAGFSVFGHLAKNKDGQWQAVTDTGSLDLGL